MVDGFNRIPKKPMMPKVIINGIIFGIKDINTILQLKNKKAIITEMINKAATIL
jgi:hypothetical protein